MSIDVFGFKDSWDDGGFWTENDLQALTAENEQQFALWQVIENDGCQQVRVKKSVLENG